MQVCILIELTIMNHFPIQRAQFASPQHLGRGQLTPKLQTISIEQLRQENQYLKRQLSDLMRAQARQPLLFQRPAQPRTNPKEEDFEVNFQRKLSKLKSKNTNRRSVDRFNQTAPVSPKRMPQNQHRQMRNITNLQFRQSPFKMIIEQDQKGRFFRNREKEQDQVTTRNVVTQPAFYQKCPQESHRTEPISIEIRNMPPRPKGHQRAESSHQPTGDHPEELTQRKFSRNTQTSFRPPSAQGIQHHKPIQMLTSQQKYLNQVPLILTSRFQERSIGFEKPEDVQLKGRQLVSSPRGHIYMQQAEVFGDRGECRQAVSSQSIEGESFVSIEKTLKEKKSVRRLRCDIYMSDDK